MSDYHVQALRPDLTSQPEAESVIVNDVLSPPENPEIPLLQTEHPKRQNSVASFPTPVRLYIEPQIVAGTLGGVLEDVYVEAVTDNDKGTFSATLGGLAVAETDGPVLRFGLEWMDWEKVHSLSRHKAHTYWQPEGPRWRLDCHLGKMAVVDKGKKLTLNGEQASNVASQIADEGTEAVLEAVSGDIDKAMGLRSALDAILDHYDLEDDVSLSDLKSTHTENFWRVGFTVGGPFERKNDPYLFLEGARSFYPEVGVYATKLGDTHFMEFMLQSEASLLRFRHRDVQADLILSGAMFVGVGVDWVNFFKKDEEFFNPEKFFIGGQGALGIRITPNFRPATYPQAVNNFYEHSADPRFTNEIPSDFLK